MSTAYSKNTLCSYYNPRVVVCITVSKGKHTEEVLAHENAAECSKCIEVAGLVFAMSNRDVSVLDIPYLILCLILKDFQKPLLRTGKHNKMFLLCR